MNPKTSQLASTPEARPQPTGANQSAENESANSDLSHVPLFMQFLELSRRKAAMRSSQDTQTNLEENTSKLTLGNELPMTEAPVTQESRVASVAFDSVESLKALVEDAMGYLKSNDPAKIKIGADKLMRFSSVEVPDKIVAQLTPEMINPLAETCAKMLTDNRYTHLYIQMLIGVLWPFMLLNDTTVFVKYNVAKRILTLAKTSTNYWVVVLSVDLLYWLYKQHELEIEPILVKMLISIIPRFSSAPGDLHDDIMLALDLVTVNAATSHLELWPELYNTIKNLGPEYEVPKLRSTVWGLQRHYKSYKSWFQEPEFRRIIELVREDPPAYLDLFLFLWQVCYDAPEKVYDSLAVAELCLYLIDFEDCFFLGKSSHGETPNIILHTILSLIPPILPNEVAGRKNSIFLHKGEITTVPKDIPNARAIFECYAQALNKAASKYERPPIGVIDMSLSICLFMANKHKQECVAVVKETGILDTLVYFVKQSTYNLITLDRPIKLFMSLIIPELKQDMAKSGLYDVLEENLGAFRGQMRLHKDPLMVRYCQEIQVQLYSCYCWLEDIGGEAAVKQMHKFPWSKLIKSK